MAKLTTDFVFEGFSVLKKNPMVFLYWGVAQGIFSLLTLAALIGFSGPALMELQAMQGQAQTDPQAALSHLSALVPGYCLTLLVTWISSSILQCAVFRAILKPDQTAFGFLRLGADEFRQMLLSLILGFIVSLVYVGLVIVASLIGGIVSGVLVGTGGSPMVAGAVMVICIILAILALLYFMSRLSLAGPQSFAEKKLNLFGSLKLSKGQGWSLFGGYVLMIILSLMMIIVIYCVAYGLLLALNGGKLDVLSDLMHPDMHALSVLMTPSYILRLGMGAIMAAPLIALYHGAPVGAYKVLAGSGV